MPIPPIRPTVTRYEVWRWRPDVSKWTLAATNRTTLEEARDRAIYERARGQVVRITESTTTRREVS